MQQHFYVVLNGKPAGPFSLEELKEMEIHPGTFVKGAGMDDFKEAHELLELRSLFGFDKALTLPQYFASLDLRLLAAAIDYLIITFIYAFFAVMAVGILKSQMGKISVVFAALIVVPGIKFIYAFIAEASFRQGTFGKYWLGLKVTDEKGRRITSSRSFVRNLAKILSFFTLGIGYLVGFLSKRQQCLHDKIAGTLVIKDRLL
ncbi:RDD family protein [Rubrolithibacter danxiaensis]|uniref:RDD family protein n=1 Tax=Rubrolithibacter danxiaensis TaxID=3390805 RepID=UPI003BF7C00B